MKKKKKTRNSRVITYKWEPTEEELKKMKATHDADMRSVVGKYMLNKYSGYASDDKIADMKAYIAHMEELYKN